LPGKLECPLKMVTDARKGKRLLGDEGRALVARISETRRDSPTWAAE